MVEGTQLRCWIGGDCLNLPFHPSILRILERVNLGKPFRVETLEGLPPETVEALLGILLRRHVGTSADGLGDQQGDALE